MYASLSSQIAVRGSPARCIPWPPSCANVEAPTIALELAILKFDELAKASPALSIFPTSSVIVDELGLHVPIVSPSSSPVAIVTPLFSPGAPRKFSIDLRLVRDWLSSLPEFAARCNVM
jgi:hypothetical protein